MQLRHHAYSLHWDVIVMVSSPLLFGLPMNVRIRCLGGVWARPGAHEAYQRRQIGDDFLGKILLRRGTVGTHCG
jgi:hypothetical protein